MQFSNPRWHQCRLHHCSPLYSWHSHTTPRAAFNSRVFLETEKEAKVLAATRLHFPISAQHPWDQQLLCPPTWAWRGENPSGGFLCCSLYSVNQCTRWSRAIEGMHQKQGTGDRRTLWEQPALVPREQGHHLHHLLQAKSGKNNMKLHACHSAACLLKQLLKFTAQFIVEKSNTSENL